MKGIILTTVLLFFILIGFSLYWFAIRPSMIKHDCSWVKKHADAVPYRPAMTQAELEAKGMIRTCKNEFSLLHKEVPTYNVATDNPFSFNTNYTFEQRRIILNATSCRDDGDRVIAEYKNPIEAKLAKEWYEKATTQQYQFCLHDKGL